MVFLVIGMALCAIAAGISLIVSAQARNRADCARAAASAAAIRTRATGDTRHPGSSCDGAVPAYAAGVFAGEGRR